MSISLFLTAESARLKMDALTLRTLKASVLEIFLSRRLSVPKCEKFSMRERLAIQKSIMFSLFQGFLGALVFSKFFDVETIGKIFFGGCCFLGAFG